MIEVFNFYVLVNATTANDFALYETGALCNPTLQTQPMYTCIRQKIRVRGAGWKRPNPGRQFKRTRPNHTSMHSTRSASCTLGSWASQTPILNYEFLFQDEYCRRPLAQAKGLNCGGYLWFLPPTRWCK